MHFKYIDLSHTIEDGLRTYKGLPPPLICDFMSREESREIYEDKSEFKISRIEMVSNTGTYLDTPFHRYEDGKDLSQIEIESCVDVEGIVVSVSHLQTLDIGRTHLEGIDLFGKAVLIHTSWDKFWNTEKYYSNHPYLSSQAADYLIANEVKIVGIDSHNIDNTALKTRPVHRKLLGNGVLIVEHLCNLEALPSSPFYFTALPPKLNGVGTFPVRAFAKIKI